MKQDSFLKLANEYLNDLQQINKTRNITDIFGNKLNEKYINEVKEAIKNFKSKQIDSKTTYPKDFALFEQIDEEIKEFRKINEGIPNAWYKERHERFLKLAEKVQNNLVYSC